ncbi:MAG: helix-turn-helix domain-containing protein [Clostridia bacterium]|nr:helix-turn-helix domain-containing protein [Clostridia bacterium]
MIGYFEVYNKRKHQLLCKELHNTGCQTHFHGEMEMSYILNGDHEITINNQSVTLSKDDIYFCNPYELHQCYSPNEGKHILFTIRPFEYEALSNLIKSPLQNFLLDKKFNLEILDLLNKIIETQNTLNGLERRGYIGLVLGKALNHYGYRKDDGKGRNQRFEEILLYIDNNYKTPITRDVIAKKFGYSPAYFSRIFKEHFHCSFLEYINNLRYERALTEISISNKSKTNTILNHGFNNVQSFYRIDRKRKKQYETLKRYHN